MRCPTCGFENPPTMRFCGNCGAALEGPGAAAEERRLVTTLFADVTGSTSLGESLDPEDVRALLARYYGIAREVVAAHGGTLEKFIGDAVMAVFGLPIAHGDDAQRALSAALELRDRVRADRRLGERLPIRAGINTGEVVASRDHGAGDFLITGDAVNVAARLQQAAEPWAILCSERTARAAGAAFAFGGPIAIGAKGKAAPLAALPLLGRLAPGATRRPPLVGRDTDLAHLDLVARRAFGERRPFLVSLIAPAGTGKTRLLEEFLDRLPTLAPNAAVVTAQCLPYGQRLTYWPLRAVLYRLIGVADDSPAEAVRAAIRAWLLEAGIEDPQRLTELLAATVGLAEAETSDRDALFAAWRLVIEAASRRQPLVVVFEDLHWSSDSLLDLVEFVMQPRGDSSVLMVALARPELLDRRPAWGGGRRNYVSLALEPLSDDAVAQLVRHLLGQPSSGIVERVVARAEGNPFYAGEIVRSVMDRVPSLSDEAGVELALATLPDTVQATVLARLDLLEANARRVLQLGAVFGRAFRAAGIAALAPEIRDQVARLADGLVERDLIRPSDTDRFAFRHILIREVAYQTLPRVERARLHAAAGGWLEERAAGREDELAELIAVHYREAATLSSQLNVEDAGAEVRRKAAHWLARAAEVATAGAASVEAARHLRGAIEFAAAEALPGLYLRLGDVQMDGGSASEAYRRALHLYRDAGSPPEEVLRSLAGLVTVYTRSQGSVATRPTDDEMFRLRAEGRALLQRVQSERVVARFLIADAFYPFWKAGEAGEAITAEAEASARQALAIAERLDDARLRSMALDALGSCAQVRGAWDEAREYGRQRLAFQDRLDLIERIDAHAVVAWASAVRGDLAEADRVSAAGLAILQPGQVPAWALHLAAWRTYTLTLLGRWDDATATAQRARQFWIETNRSAAGYAVRGFVAALDVARGRQDSALVERWREVLGEIRAQFEASGGRGVRFWYTHVVAAYADLDLEVVRAEGPAAFLSSDTRGVERFERTLSLLADHRRPPDPQVTRPIAEHAATHDLSILEAQARRCLGLALSDAAELRRALDLFERCGAVPYAARVRCELALLAGDGEQLAAGVRALELLGDLDQIGRIERVRARPSP